MGSALEIHELTKKYEDFTLDHISFQVPSGSIVGLIGENGAGKTSTINAVLGLIKKDSGEIEILGENADNLSSPVKEEIGVVFDGSNFSEELTPVKLNKVLREVYSSWDQALFSKLLDQMEVPLSKKIKTFSKGMKMKLSIAVALAHHPKLLILDEATSGLDPVMRDDILDIFLDFVQDEEHSILVSSHITSDLEKVADYIVFIHKGKIIFSKSKDELLENYGIIKCGREQFEALDEEDQITYRRLDYEWQVLTADRNRAQKKYPKALVIPATIDEIMLLYVKGEHR
ncbi:MAG TPA: ABC transporter ATP-binding protein [Candidatus Blautia merdigallinarum]|uniref:ABC transporter ATP-binding protein n=1 Tax=Candidatus Blautia merdigallinarum TaxID=2838495 RepID=A0A9D2N2C9_9FIRM|nr:ABC transporter ATP-binding protein [Candidatus Blautia merdigallinarum]